MLILLWAGRFDVLPARIPKGGKNEKYRIPLRVRFNSLLHGIPFSHSDAEEQATNVTKSGDSAYHSAAVFRFPEHKYFVVPKEAHAFTVHYPDGENKIEEVAFYEYSSDSYREKLDLPILVSQDGKVPISKFAGKKLFAHVKIKGKNAEEIESPFISGSFINANGKEIPQGTYDHFTGWVSVGSSAPYEVIFQSYSPIASFYPLLVSREEGEFVEACFVGRGEISEPTKGIRYSFLSPFRVSVMVPAFKEDYRLSAE